MALLSRGFAGFLGGLGQGYIQGKLNQQAVRQAGLERQNRLDMAKMQGLASLRQSILGQLNHLRSERNVREQDLLDLYGNPLRGGQPNPYFIADPAQREAKINGELSAWDNYYGTHVWE